MGDCCPLRSLGASGTQTLTPSAPSPVPPQETGQFLSGQLTVGDVAHDAAWVLAAHLGNLADQLDRGNPLLGGLPGEGGLRGGSAGRECAPAWLGPCLGWGAGSASLVNARTGAWSARCRGSLRHLKLALLLGADMGLL